MSFRLTASSAMPASVPLGLLATLVLASQASADILDIGIVGIKSSDPVHSHIPSELQALGFSMANTRVDIHFTIDTDQPDGPRYASAHRTGRLFNTLNDRYAAGDPTGGSLFVALDVGGLDRLIISGSYSSTHELMMNGWTADNDQFVLEGPHGTLGDGSLAAVLSALQSDSLSTMRASFALSNVDTREEVEVTLAGTSGDYTVTVAPCPGTLMALVGSGLVRAFRRRHGRGW